MKTILTVTAPDGTTFTRTTEAKYTHVTLILEDVKGVQQWGAVSWSSSQSLAQKQYDKWSKVSCVLKCVIAPVNN